VSIYAREVLVNFQDMGVGSAASAAIFLMIAVVDGDLRDRLPAQPQDSWGCDMVRSSTGRTGASSPRNLHAFAVVALYTLFPFYWMIASSLKSGQAIFDVTFLPDLKFNNTRHPVGRRVPAQPAEFADRRRLRRGALAGAGDRGGLCAGPHRFRGRSPIMFLFLAVSMFPQIALLSGLFEMIRWLGLYNTLGSLIFAYMIFTLPFNIWVLTTFMRSLPRRSRRRPSWTAARRCASCAASSCR
jgi:hypothetical protein